MPNTLTLTGLTENLFRARDIVARELTGFIPAVLVNAGSEGVSLGGTVVSYRTSTPQLNTSYTPAMTIPASDDPTVTTDTMTIGQVANVRIPLEGEKLRQLDNTAGQRVIDDILAQAIRRIVNTIEAHCGTIIYRGASRAVGTAGTAPFGSDFNVVASLRQILQDNGCPDDGQRSLVMNTTAGTRLRQLASIYRVNEVGTTDTLRRGTLLDLFGIMMRESAGVANHTKGTGASYLTNSTTLVTGNTAIPADTGSGTIIAGDIVTFASGAGSGRNYVVGSALAGGSFSINQPGLAGAIPDNNAITVGNDYAANVGFHRNAVELVLRPPAMPYGGDAAVDRMTMFDDQTGLVFEAALYKGYGMNMIDLTTFYQCKVWKPEFVATLLG